MRDWSLPLPVAHSVRFSRFRMPAGAMHMPRDVRRAHGLTLVEVMITLVIFIFLAGFAMMAVNDGVTQWTTGERRRVLFARAAGAMDAMADDLRLTITQEPTGIEEIKARFISDYEAGTKQQRLMFVRSFE